VDNVASAISELAEFLMAHDHDGQELTMAREMKEREIKNRQKLLRNLRVLELVIEIVALSASDKSAASGTNMRKECFRVILNYLKGNSHKNKNYLSRLFKSGSSFTEVRTLAPFPDTLLLVVYASLTQAITCTRF